MQSNVAGPSTTHRVIGIIPLPATPPNHQFDPRTLFEQLKA